MKLTTPCQHCGSAVPFGEADRGFEVYCPSCARANPIPTCDDAPDPPPTEHDEIVASERPHAAESTPSVFSDQTADTLGQEIAGSETCFCGAEVPVRVDDYGGTVYCPSCGTEIQVGRSLEGGKFRPGRGPSEAEREHRAEPTSMPSPDEVPFGDEAPGRGQAVAATLVVLAVAAALVYVTWQPAQRSPGQPETAESVPGSRVSVAGPHSSGAENAAAEEVSQGGRITMAAIDELLEHPQPVDAIVQARIWSETLAEEGPADDDPRPTRLIEVIASLEAGLKRPPEPEPSVVEFRKAIERLADALKGGDLESARQAARVAEDLARRHADTLAPYQHRFDRLKQRLTREETLSDRAEGIVELLEKADRLQASDHVTEALEAESEARFLALTTPLTKAEAEDLDARQRRLAPKLRLARGRRAVADARRLAAAGDHPARDREVRRALALLPGLPESRIAPLLDQIHPWIDEARASNDRDPPDEPVSHIAREIVRRDAYEKILEHYGSGDIVQLLSACRRHQALPVDEYPVSQARTHRIEDLLFDGLEHTIGEQTDPPTSQTEARRLLDDARPWKTHPRWHALDALLGAR